MTSARLGGRPTWVTAVTGAAALAGLLGLFAGVSALAGSTSAGSAGAVVPIVGSLAILIGIGGLVLAAGTWLGRPWAPPLGLVVGPAIGAIAVIDGLFVGDGLIGPLPILGVGLGTVILVGLGRSGTGTDPDRD